MADTMKKWWMILAACTICLNACSQKATDSPTPTNDDGASVIDENPAVEQNDTPKNVPQNTEEKYVAAIHHPKQANADAPKPVAGNLAEEFIQNGDYDAALRMIYEKELESGPTDELEKSYAQIIKDHPLLNAAPRKLEPGKDISSMKRLGGGSSLVYKFIKDGETIAAFKPFQKRYQSNYRSEIAAYRLCPVMKCGFDVPVNLPVYFDFDEFSSLYAHNPSNPKDEFAEIIPTKEDGSFRVYGTYKYWIKEYGEYPIEFSSYWKSWLNPGTSRDELNKPASSLLPEFAQKHERGQKYAKKLAPHFENLSIYDLARQISNMLVFDFLINNWDRFSGAPSLYGVNCQFANGRIMSIDNGAGFAQTPNQKPEKHLREITRFSRLTYEAIRNFDKDWMLNFLFPNASKFEMEKFETFWNQREKYLKYVEGLIVQNGESETFFFE